MQEMAFQMANPPVYKKFYHAFLPTFLSSFPQAFLANEDVGDTLNGVEALIKKHEDFDKSLAAQEEKIKALDESATRLVGSEHYAAPEIAKQQQAVSHNIKIQQVVQECEEIAYTTTMSTAVKIFIGKIYCISSVADEMSHVPAGWL